LEVHKEYLAQSEYTVDACSILYMESYIHCFWLTSLEFDDEDDTEVYGSLK